MVTSGYPTSSARKTEIVDVANGLICSDMAEFLVELYTAVQWVPTFLAPLLYAVVFFQDKL